jgi:hypothetical protein
MSDLVTKTLALVRTEISRRVLSASVNAFPQYRTAAMASIA